MRILLYVALFLCATGVDLHEHDDEDTGINKNLARYISTSSSDQKLPHEDDGHGVGVSYYGFRASAGLRGGILALNGSPGGPHAEASTPFGLGVGAGVGHRTQKDNSILYAYAEAQAGSIFLGVCLLLEPSGPKIMTFKRCAKRFGLRLHEVYAKRED